MVQSISLDGAWLTDSEEAHIVLVQLPPPLIPGLLETEASRPSVLNVLTQLLGHPRRLSEIVTQGRPAIVLLPELALAFKDWATVDALIRNYPHQVILITGFSFTSGEALVNWVNETPTLTTRRAAWLEAHQPAAPRVYNGGWCWVHKPETTTCIAFQKTTAEQRTERQIQNLDTGQYTFCLELDDLIIFPIICSDLLAAHAGHRVIAAKISGHLSNSANDNRKVVIAGLLAQEKAHASWRTAIADVARQIDTERVNVCIVNWAYDIIVNGEDDDQWRDFSGVYIAGERRPALFQMHPMRRFKTEQIEGAISRITESCVLGGPMRWTFNAATTRHVWAVNIGYSLDVNGSLGGPCCDNPIKYELTRFVRRQSEPTNPPTVLTASSRSALSAVMGHLIGGGSPNAQHLAHTTLFGYRDNDSESEVNADNLSKFSLELNKGLKALGALTSVVHVSWQINPGRIGQFESKKGNTAILVWSSPELSITVKQKIDRWMSDAFWTEPVIIFSNVSSSLLGNAVSSRRQDIGSAPGPLTRSAVEPTRQNYILQAGLDELGDCLHEDTAQKSAAAITHVLDTKLVALAGKKRHT